MAAVLALSLFLVGSTAEACSCDAKCATPASPTEIGPIYPATVNYVLSFSCIDTTQCGCVNTITSSLVTDAFSGITIWCFPRAGDTISYSLNVTWEQCKAWGTPNGDGTYTLTNVVNATGEWSTVLPCEANVLCKPPPPPPTEGCTATPGYWKNHSSGRRYNATWADVGGPGAIFFPASSGGLTYLEVLSNPTETEKYFILGRQYVAAVLNGFAGASTTPKVQAALAFAESFFTAYGPHDTLGKDLEDALVQNAAILDGYNNGLEGPPHCE